MNLTKTGNTTAIKTDAYTLTHNADNPMYIDLTFINGIGAELFIPSGCDRDELIDTVLHSLNPREAEVVRLYYGLANEPPLTLDQIGTRFKLTRERVRQIKEVALSKLRHPRICTRLRAYVET